MKAPVVVLSAAFADSKAVDPVIMHKLQVFPALRTCSFILGYSRIMLKGSMNIYYPCTGVLKK